MIFPRRFTGLVRLSLRSYPEVQHFRSVCSSLVNYSAKMSYSAVEHGKAQTTDYRVYFRDNNGPISPLHDIPLWADKANSIFNMVVEVPRWTNAKMEISLKEPLNPIKQDVKKGQLRYVASCFPHHGYIWNYGALPQTWEDPTHMDPNTGCNGDNDPIDILDIGSRVAKRGEIIQVKVLGTLALIDEGETDWKLVAINVADPLASVMTDIADVDKYFPGLLKATVEWFRIYKIPDGKPENKFAFNGEAKDSAFAHNVIDEVHKFWQNLIKKDTSDVNCANTSLVDSPHKITAHEAATILANAPTYSPPQQELDDSVHKWHYIRHEKPRYKL